MAHSAVKVMGVDLAKRVLKDLPRVNLAITESLSGSTLVGLMESEVDLALVYNPPPDRRPRIRPVLEEKLVLLGKPELIGAQTDAIAFDSLLELPLILLRQGVSARALMDDLTLLRKLESRASMQMNSVQAIAGLLEAGLGCAIGTPLFMEEQLARGVVGHRPIDTPELLRTLYLCELANRPPTFAMEAVRGIVLDLITEAVSGGRWQARLLSE